MVPGRFNVQLSDLLLSRKPVLLFGAEATFLEHQWSWKQEKGKKKAGMRRHQTAGAAVTAVDQRSRQEKENAKHGTR